MLASTLLLATILGAAPDDISDDDVKTAETRFECAPSRHDNLCAQLRAFRERGEPLDAAKVAGRWVALLESHDGHTGRAGPAFLSVLPRAQRQAGQGPADHTGDVIAVVGQRVDMADSDHFRMFQEYSVYQARNRQFPDGNLLVKEAREASVPNDAYVPLQRTGRSTAFSHAGGMAFARTTPWGITIVGKHVNRSGRSDLVVFLATFPWGKTRAVGGDTDTAVKRPRTTPSIQELQAGCDGDDVVACKSAGDYYEVSRVPDRDARALAAFSKACNNRGPAGACERAAHFEKDPAAKAALLEKGCAALHWHSCEAQASMLLKTGVAADRERAVGILGEYCDAKNTFGCGDLARVLGGEPGEGAMAQLTARCDAGIPIMCLALARRLVREKPGDGDARKAAITLLVNGCNGGFGASCTELDKFPDSPEARDAALARVARAEQACRAQPKFGSQPCFDAFQALTKGNAFMKADRAREGALRLHLCSNGVRDFCKSACELTKDPEACKRR